MLEGIVQGVGFRPFVKRLADRLSLPGIVFNTAGGLVIEIDAEESQARSFVSALCAEAPRAARVDRCVSQPIAQGDPYTSFLIAASAVRDQSFTLTAPDLATCSECLAEIRNPGERRFRYPFTNCTNCGPRYSITVSTPYDRVNTTMCSFALCSPCAAEYANPADRRFHAEPVACPACGPRLSQELSGVIGALKAGRIVAVKGLGGFQLACDAFHVDAVNELRAGKRRSRKPFAVMMRNLETVAAFCELEETERHLLLSPAAPIVLLALRADAQFAPGIAPGLRQLGVMLPYTPLHHLLLADALNCLVMTSGNLSEEPIVTTNMEALTKLTSVAKQVVTHDRDIFMRVDDSIARVFEGAPRILRRARGYTPRPIELPFPAAEVLATGAELKSTFCFTKGRYAIPSQHIGDLENYETLGFYEETLKNLLSVYQGSPQLIAHDLHPDYLSTRWALRRPEPKLAVQHHHAHIASCMAENGLHERVIGVAFDGTGWGTDGQIWGGEFLVCDYRGFARCAHFRYVPLPGGDRAARQGWRMAAAHLYDALGPASRDLALPCWSAASDTTWNLIERVLARPALHTSSCGRLFDAVSAICGISLQSSYEGESAMLFEAAASKLPSGTYPLHLATETTPWTIDTRQMIGRIANDVATGRSPGEVARCFHDSLARIIESVCSNIREKNCVNKVCFSGGAFQNFTLLSKAAGLLRDKGFQVYLHSQVPPNDGGISLGQAVIGAVSLERT